MLKRLLITVFAILSLPMASFAYAEEWDDLIGLDDTVESNSRYQNRASTSVDQQRLLVVKRLDQEILILRAEMSQRNGDVRQVQQYVDQLSKQYVLPSFKPRVEKLRQYVATHSEEFGGQASEYVQKLRFPLNDRNAVVAIVLPTSGNYGVAGESIQEALQKGIVSAGFKGKLIAIDSAIYSSAFEIWEILKYYEPDFIFGPLDKSMIIQWQQLRTGVSTLYFNDAGYLGVGEFSLSPSRQAGLEQVFQLLNQAQYKKLLVLRDTSEKSKELEAAFREAWLTFNNPQDYTSEVIEGNVGQAIDDAMGVSASKARSRWLQKVVEDGLEQESRPRADIEAVVSFVPQNLAIQIAPYLNFLSAKNEVTHVWYPSQTPSSAYLKFNRDAWQQTFAILPQSIKVNASHKRSKIDHNSKDGLFYALGRVAVEIVTDSSLSTSVDSVEETPYGSFVRNASGQFHLLPIVYWADNGVFEKYYRFAN